MKILPQTERRKTECVTHYSAVTTGGLLSLFSFSSAEITTQAAMQTLVAAYAKHLAVAATHAAAVAD